MGINTKTKVYLGFLVALAITLYIYLALNFSLGPIGLLAFWSILAIVVESLLIPLPNNTIGVSVGYAVNIATIIIGGPLLATTTSSLGVLLRAPKVPGRGYIHVVNLPLYKSVFNV